MNGIQPSTIHLKLGDTGRIRRGRGLCRRLGHPHTDYRAQRYKWGRRKVQPLTGYAAATIDAAIL